jgi:hypothetical protein
VPYEEVFGMGFLGQYRRIVSDRLFMYLVEECAKGLGYGVVGDKGKY